MIEEEIPYKHGILVFSGYVSTRLFIVILFTVSLGRLFDLSHDDQLLIEAYAGIFGEALAACVAWLLVSTYYEFRKNDVGKLALGLTAVSLRQVMSSILGGFSLAASIIVIGIWFPSQATGGASALDIYTTNGATLRYLWLVVGIFVAPFVEELLFRGIVFSTITSHFNVFLGAMASIMLFMLVHLPQVNHGWHSAMAILALGVTCTFIRVKDGSLWTAIVIHASYNMYLTLWVIISP